MSTAALLTVLAGALACGGWIALCLTMTRHAAQVYGRGGQARIGVPRLRLLGWSGVTLAFMPCIAARGWHMGPLLYCGMLTASAMLLAMLLEYAPRTLPWLARAAAGLAAVTALALVALASLPA